MNSETLFETNRKIQCIDDLLVFLFRKPADVQQKHRIALINEGLRGNDDMDPFFWALKQNETTANYPWDTRKTRTQYISYKRFSLYFGSGDQSDTHHIKIEKLANLSRRDNWNSFLISMENYLDDNKSDLNCFTENVVKWDELISGLLAENVVVLSNKNNAIGVNQALSLIKDVVKKRIENGGNATHIATEFILFLSLYFLIYISETANRSVGNAVSGNSKLFIALLINFLGYDEVEQYASNNDAFNVYFDDYKKKDKKSSHFKSILSYFNGLLQNADINPLLFPSFQFLENTHLSGDKLVRKEIEIIKQEFQNSKVMIISGGGGLGKTTLAKTISLSSELYNDGILPIYFPIAHLNQQDLINRKKDWLLSEILRYWTNQRENSTFTGLFAKIMDDTIDSYLILDGLNEANKEVYDSVIDELVFLLDPNGRYKRMRILIFSRNSRDIKKDLKNPNIVDHKLIITNNQKRAFLEENGWADDKIRDYQYKTTLWEILNPFYLTLLVQQTNRTINVSSVEELLYLSYHDENNAYNRPETQLEGFSKAQSVLLLNILFPFISFKLLEQEQLSISTRDLSSSLRTLIKSIRENDVLKDFLLNSGDEKQATNDSVEEPRPYIDRLIKQGLITIEQSDMFSVHQIIRDYFAAYWQLRVDKAVYFYNQENESVFPNTLSVCWNIPAEVAHFITFLWKKTNFSIEFDSLKQSALINDAYQHYKLALQKWRLLLFDYHTKIDKALLHENERSGEEGESLQSLRKGTYECVEHIHATKQALNNGFKTEQDFLEACELSRYKREGFAVPTKEETASSTTNKNSILESDYYNPDVDGSMKVTLDVYEYVLDNATTLHFGQNYRSLLNQLAKGFLLEAQYVANKTQHIGIARETVNRIISLFQRNENRTVFSYIDENQYTNMLKRVVELLNAFIDDIKLLDSYDELKKAGDALLRFSILAKNPESMNLYAFRKEKESAGDDDYRMMNLTTSFICYFAASKIKHARVQVYSIRKTLEILLEEGLSILDGLKSKEDSLLDCIDWSTGKLNCNSSNYLRRTKEINEDTTEVIMTLISSLEAAGDDYADYLLGLYYFRTQKFSLAKQYMSKFYNAKKASDQLYFALAIEMLIVCRKAEKTSKKEVPQFTSMKELFNATENGSRGTLLDDLLTSLLINYNEAGKRKAIDRWQPTKHYLEHMIKRLEILKYGELVSGAENNDATEYEKVCSMIKLIQDAISPVENETPKNEAEVDKQVSGKPDSKAENGSEATDQSDNSGESSPHKESLAKRNKKTGQQSKLNTSSTSSR